MSTDAHCTCVRMCLSASSHVHVVRTDARISSFWTSIMMSCYIFCSTTILECKPCDRPLAQQEKRSDSVAWCDNVPDAALDTRTQPRRKIDVRKKIITKLAKSQKIHQNGRCWQPKPLTFVDPMTLPSKRTATDIPGLTTHSCMQSLTMINIGKQGPCSNR